jgi:hypothetical protein
MGIGAIILAGVALDEMYRYETYRHKMPDWTLSATALGLIGGLAMLAFAGPWRTQLSLLSCLNEFAVQLVVGFVVVTVSAAALVLLPLTVFRAYDVNALAAAGLYLLGISWYRPMLAKPRWLRRIAWTILGAIVGVALAEWAWVARHGFFEHEGAAVLVDLVVAGVVGLLALAGSTLGFVLGRRA